MYNTMELMPYIWCWWLLVFLVTLIWGEYRALWHGQLLSSPFFPPHALYFIFLSPLPRRKKCNFICCDKVRPFFRTGTSSGFTKHLSWLICRINLVSTDTFPTYSLFFFSYLANITTCKLTCRPFMQLLPTVQLPDRLTEYLCILLMLHKSVCQYWL